MKTAHIMTEITLHIVFFMGEPTFLYVRLDGGAVAAENEPVPGL